MARVTQADLARELGVSPMTVSLALRGHHRISPATRERVARLAQERGFRPDPILSELGQQRWKRTDPAFLGTVGLLIPEASAGTTPNLVEGQVASAARERLKQLGYGFDVLGADAYREPAQMARVLHSRGIVGLLHTRLPHEFRAPAFPWERFVSVALNYGHSAPPQHAVVLERFPSWLELWDRLRARGYRRPGWIGFDEPDAEDFHVNEAARLYASRRVYGTDPLPPLRLRPVGNLNSAAVAGAIREWWRRERPDGLVALNEYVLEIALQALPSGAVRGGCGLCLTGEPGRWSGFLEEIERTAAVAVDLLHQCLRQGRVGRESVPLRLVVPRPWHEGESLPPVGRNRSACDPGSARNVG